MQKNFFFIFFCVLFFTNALQAYEKPQLSEEFLSEKEYTQTKETPFALKPVLKKEKSGTLLSVNTGIGFLLENTQHKIILPTYEMIIGYHLGNHLKITGAYQHQSSDYDIHLKGRSYIANTPFKYDMKTKSKIEMQLLALKLTLAPIHPKRWAIFTLYPYFSMGVGQGFVDIKDVLSFRRVVYLGDIGLAMGTRLLSFTLGCRYNNWSWEDQLYSVIPYAGLQISF